MGLKKFNAKKEIKKLKRRSNKLKKVGVIGAIIGTIFIVSSYSLYSYTKSSVAFNSTINKRVKTTVTAVNGTVGILADKILSSNTIQTSVDFSKGYPNDTDKDNSKSGLYKANDDQGESYYFRGDKKLLNNNVEFGGKKWKIVRINGDGTIRLILVNNFTNSGQPLSVGNKIFNDYTDNTTQSHNMVGFTYGNTSGKECTKEHPCEVTYNNGEFNNSNFGGTNSTIKTELESWYKNNLKGVDNKIANGYFCNDTSSPRYMNDETTLYYGAYDRIINSTPPKPSLQCHNPKDKGGTINNYGGIYKTKIGLLTADEMVMGGLSYYENSQHATSDNYLYSGDWWNLSPTIFNGVAYVFVGFYGSTYYRYVRAADDIVPVINLKADVVVTGSGASGDPYKVVEGNTYTKEGDYKESQTFKVYENEDSIYNNEPVTCTSGATGSYDVKTKTLTINNQTQDTTCTIKFNKAIKIFDKKYPLIEEQPDFTKGFPNSGTSEIDTKRLSGLYQAEDNYGKPSYYFRGDKNLLNNNVEFGGKKWKIVRINEDGTIRLILVNNFTNSGQSLSVGNEIFNDYTNNTTQSHNMVGFTYDNNIHQCTRENPCEVIYNNGEFNNSNFGGQNSTLKTELESWYKNNLKGVDNKIANGYFCNDTSSPRYMNDETTLYYGAYDRIINSTPPKPSLQCHNPKDKGGTINNYGGIYKTKIGLLTADEMVMGGLSYYENSQHATSDNYLYSGDWWNLSPTIFNGVAYVFVGFYGSTYYRYVRAADDIVPVINLNSNVTASGDGSEENPFVIN